MVLLISVTVCRTVLRMRSQLGEKGSENSMGLFFQGFIYISNSGV